MGRGLQSKPEPRAGFGLERAFRSPAAQFVIARQHFGQLVGQPLGRAGLGGLFEQTRRQGVVLGGEARAVVVVALHVPDTLAYGVQLVHGELFQAGGGKLRLHVGQRPGETGEQADTGRVEHGGGVLKRLDQFGLAVGHQRIGLDRNAQHFRSHRVTAQMAGAAVAGRIGQAHALNAARVVGRELLALDAHAQFRVAVLGRQAFAAQRQFLAEALAAGGDFGEVGQRLGRAEWRFHTELFLGQQAHVVQLHHRAHGGAESDGVHAVFIAEEVGVGQRLQIVDAVGRAQRPGGFIFQTARCAPVLRLVLDAEMVFVDLADAAASDGAAKARLVGDQIGLAIGFARLVHGLAGDVFRAFELHVAVVARGQGADFVDHVHQHLGAVFRQTLAGDGVVVQHFFACVDRSHERLGVAHIAHAQGATHRDGLEVLATHHRAHARATGGAVQIVDDGRIHHPVFTRTADGADADQRVLVMVLDPGLGFPHGLAPDRRGVEQFGLVIFDGEIHRLGRFAFDDDHVPARHLQLGAEVAARIGAGDCAGQRAFGDDRIAPAGGRHGAGERPGGVNQLVVGRERIDLGVDLLDEILGRQPALADVLARPLPIQRLALDGALREVHAQNFSGPGHGRLLNVVAVRPRRSGCPACRPIAACATSRSSWHRYR